MGGLLWSLSALDFWDLTRVALHESQFRNNTYSSHWLLYNLWAEPLTEAGSISCELFMPPSPALCKCPLSSDYPSATTLWSCSAQLFILLAWRFKSELIKVQSNRTNTTGKNLHIWIQIWWEWTAKNIQTRVGARTCVVFSERLHSGFNLKACSARTEKYVFSPANERHHLFLAASLWHNIWAQLLLWSGCGYEEMSQEEKRISFSWRMKCPGQN